MASQQLQEFLDSRGVKYVKVTHSRAFTAQAIAASAHIAGKEFAKTVIVKVDGQMVMVVVPATAKLDLKRLEKACGGRRAVLANETEFAGRFPGCELGAMPPFGNLYGMEVYAESHLADDEEIAFNAGTHTELYRLAYEDFVNLVHPKVTALTH